MSPGQQPWTEARFRSALTAFCFGSLDESDREAVEQHLFACDGCWREFQRLDAAVRTLRFEPTLQPVLPMTGIVSLLGLSGRLNAPFAGHRGFVVAASAAFGLLFAVPVLVELAYRFDLFQSLALRLLTPVWLWMSLMTVLAFWVDVRAVRSGSGSVLPSVAVHGAATAVLCIALLPMLPVEPTVDATFQTYPVHLGYLKSVFYAWMVGPAFLVLPFHFVVAAQRELAAGRLSQIFAVLAGEKAAVAPRRTLYPRVWALVVYLGAIVALNYFGVNHLFGNLLPSPHRSTFMALVLLRVGIWIGLAAGALWWYAACVDELKREALALRTVSDASTAGLSIR